MITNEYQCPFCFDWVLKTDFKTHQDSHFTHDLKGMKKPESLEELQERFSPLGMYEER
jgi:wobble nucleotide-excising tRNase